MKPLLKILKSSESERASFPDAEARMEWLSVLLQAYAVVDAGVKKAVSEEEKRRGAKLACAPGCDVCCKYQKDIPVYPLELNGIYWYAAERVLLPAREIVRTQLRQNRKDNPCPFLVSGSCAVYPVRPISCRQYNVFGQRCAEGEDAFHTRRGDVLTPIKEYADAAVFVMLPFYGIGGEKERMKAVKEGYLHKRARNIQDMDFRSLVRMMDSLDSAFSGR